jgi:hypothetical protein
MSLADWKPCVALCLDYQSVIPKPDPAYGCCWDCGLLASDPQFPTCLAHFDKLRHQKPAATPREPFGRRQAVSSRAKMAAREPFGPRQTISNGAKVGIGLATGLLFLIIAFILLRR